MTSPINQDDIPLHDAVHRFVNNKCHSIQQDGLQKDFCLM